MKQKITTLHSKTFGKIVSKRLRLVAYGLAGCVVLLVVCQLLYPADRMRPFASYGDVHLGMQSKDQAEVNIAAKYSDSKIIIKTNTKSYTRSTAEVGLEPDVNETVSRAIDYPLWQRIVPGSIFSWHLVNDSRLSVREDTPKLLYFASEIRKENLLKPKNASVTLDDDKAVLVPAKDGDDYPLGHVASAIRNVPLSNTMSVTIKPVAIAPERTDDEVGKVLDVANDVLQKPLDLNLAGDIVSVPKSTVATWITFEDSKNSDELQLGIDDKKVSAYLDESQKAVYIAPGVTVVNTLDGNEVSRTSGAFGQGINKDQTIDQIKKQFLNNRSTQEPIIVPLVNLPPRVAYERSYTTSQAGLHALLTDIAKQKGGYGISVIELSDRQRVASANGNKQFTTASTYKLFVAYAVLKNIENGSWKWASKIEGTKTVSQCFDLMIINSDNPCAEAFGYKIGWSNIQNMMRGLGLNSTSLGQNFYSTATDEALFLRKLHDGSLLSSSSRTKLIDVMKRQVYRAGIPAGTGVSVADKVGFLEGYLHDAAIVFGPNGPYVLVIMSQGSSWAEIADAANQIHNYMSR